MFGLLGAGELGIRQQLSDRQVFYFDESSLDWNINLNYYYSILLMQTHQNTSKSIKEIFKFDLHSL